MELVLVAVVVALLVVIDFAKRADRYRSQSAELAIEFSARARAAARIVGGVAYLIGVCALCLHPPQSPGQKLVGLIVLVAWASGVSFVLNKRIALTGRCVIDVSFTARRRELPIRAPVRFEPTAFGEHLHLRASDVFLPGTWMNHGSQGAREIRERFRAQVFARADTAGSSDPA
jgi:hypothetical protein